MNHLICDTVRKRLERVEQENLRLKRVGAAVLVGFLAAMLMGQATPKARVVEAEQFLVKDASDGLRAELSVAADGSVY